MSFDGVPPTTGIMLSNYPELPILTGEESEDLSLAVFNHPTATSLDTPQHPGFGNGDRLFEMGVQVLQCTATKYFFRHPAMFTAVQIRERVGRVLSGQKIHEWLDFYSLKHLLTVGPEFNREEVLLNDREMSQFFCTYIGAVFYSRGTAVVESFVHDLLNASLDGVKVEAEDEAMSGQEGPSPPTYTPPPIPSSHAGPPASHNANTVTPLPPNISMLPRSFIHETATKNRVHISYSESFEGPPHNPLWTVRCLVDEEERGRATARNKAAGRDIAARHAFVAMGWHQNSRN